MTCDDHNGHHSAYMQQWDGTKWVKVSDWIAPMKDKVRPMLEAAAKDYVSKDTGMAEAHASPATSRADASALPAQAEFACVPSPRARERVEPRSAGVHMRRRRRSHVRLSARGTRIAEP